ncbi:bis(5'-nucleosyl)-tetraphosphatase PrpE [Mesobacillus subterraneus]|uniref:bis(5'-nucleosyl)-tetraphosphatase PrpE n=1 Tax=Mesobacillus subterraneus TaxID=285983 RepID=UPI002040A619|nr:bis(5'-nucleosyl)-tetraphosphatase PrpE [Mesobacillus subterraneus]MCM3663067.1 bis(5'-nucleosyl)-tetraphosphatase PrpE [Mesobacillus subterraneus]MCM3682757.1 bis(5'-nucleosyl)-tetraphosphatase PrpE [Mesobacillus subterraneus]
MNLDIIGDIHGCYAEFQQLTIQLGYDWESGIPIHPEGRMLAFVGDLTDRGPESLRVAQIVWELVMKSKTGYYVPGNHCNKLYRYLLGNKVQTTHGLETTVAEYLSLDTKQKNIFRQSFLELYDSSPLYQVLDHGRLIIAHAGIREDYIGKNNSKVKTFVLYGDITGQSNPDGTPVRRDWAKSYNGKALIVYGHTPVKEPRVVNNTYNIDTGVVFGWRLTALKYPEMELMSVPSTMPYVPEKFREID